MLKLLNYSKHNNQNLQLNRQKLPLKTAIVFVTKTLKSIPKKSTIFQKKYARITPNYLIHNNIQTGQLKQENFK